MNSWTQRSKSNILRQDKTYIVFYIILFSFVYEVSEVGFYLKVSNHNARRPM